MESTCAVADAGLKATSLETVDQRRRLRLLPSCQMSWVSKLLICLCLTYLIPFRKYQLICGKYAAVPQIMITKLADFSTQHSLIGPMSFDSPSSTSSTNDFQSEHARRENRHKVITRSASIELSYSPSATAQLLPLSTPPPGLKGRHSTTNVKSVLACTERTIRLSSEDDFEGIMLDNGASGTPSGLPAFLRYCQFVGIQPTLSHSSNRFVGIGSGVVTSLGMAHVRLPLGNTHFIEFETDVVAQDVPLMFGLD